MVLENAKTLAQLRYLVLFKKIQNTDKIQISPEAGNQLLYLKELNQLKKLLVQNYRSSLDKTLVNPVEILNLSYNEIFEGMTEDEASILAKKLKKNTTSIQKIYNDQLKELNPALGTRSVRMALVSEPEIYLSQYHAIFEAAKAKGLKTVDINLPLIIDPKEVKYIKASIQNIHDVHFPKMNFRIVAVIETARAVRFAAQIAAEADAIAINSYNLTQNILQFAAVDSKKFINVWKEQGIYPKSPLETLPSSVSQQLVETAIRIQTEKSDYPIYAYGHNLPTLEAGIHEGKLAFNQNEDSIVVNPVKESQIEQEILKAAYTSATKHFIRTYKEYNVTETDVPDYADLPKISEDTLAVAKKAFAEGHSIKVTAEFGFWYPLEWAIVYPNGTTGSIKVEEDIPEASLDVTSARSVAGAS